MIAQKKRQYITDQSGKRVGVVLDVKTFGQIEDELDELESIRAYDKAKPETDAAVQRGDFLTIQEYLAKRTARKKAHRNNRRR